MYFRNLTPEIITKARLSKPCHPPVQTRERIASSDGHYVETYLHFEVEEFEWVTNQTTGKKQPIRFEVSVELERSQAECLCMHFFQTGSLCGHIASLLWYEAERLEIPTLDSNLLLANVLNGVAVEYTGQLKDQLLELQRRYNDPAWRTHLYQSPTYLKKSNDEATPSQTEPF